MDTLLEIRHIDKSFGNTKVLDDVSFDVRKGEVLALSGENGAGKSTLMKILSGVYPPDSGEIVFKGKPYESYNLHYSRQVGVSLIYQELSIARNITVMENIFMGSEMSSFGFCNKEKMRKAAEEILEALQADFLPTQKASELNIAQRQQIEIARAISHNSDLIIMDEPSASLSDKEVHQLFEVIRSLKEKGITIIYISHKMDEIQQIADRVAVIRDGKYIGETAVDNTDEIIYMMVGRSLESFYVENPDDDMPTHSDYAPTVLQLDDISDEKGMVRNVSCTLETGKIIGVSGLVGAGRSELFQIVFGAAPRKHGRILINGKEVTISHPIDAMKHGIGMVPEDRKLQGLFLDMTSMENIVENKIADNGYAHFFLNKKKNIEMTDSSIRELNIKTGRDTITKMTSGGNQQKILLSRWLNISPDILILDEPTRGIDVGAKQEIYKIIRKLVAQGMLVIFISSELPEIIHLSDRVLVMKEGVLVGDITDTSKINQEYIMRLCTHKQTESDV